MLFRNKKRVSILAVLAILLCGLIFAPACSSGGGGAGTGDGPPVGPPGVTPPPDEPPAGSVWNLMSTADDWDIEYDGYGVVLFDATTGVTLQPKIAAAEGETHAALVLSKRSKETPLQNFKATIVVTTEQQLRTNTPPNAWECFWVFFNYTIGDNGKKKTNYFILKPNGIELGKAFDEVGQEFLATLDTPKLEIGKSNEIVITKNGQNLEVTVDGKSALIYDGTTGPYPLYDVAGSIGLYTEDAKVRVQSVSIEPL